MNYSELVPLLVTLFASAILGYATNAIQAKRSVHFVWRMALLLLASAFCAFALTTYSHFTSPMTRLEGTWIESYESDSLTLFGIGTIERDDNTGQPKFSGVGYDSTGAKVADWESSKAWLSKRTLDYRYSGRSFKQGAQLKHRSGTALIKFNGDLLSGSGEFNSLPTDTIPRPFRIWKVLDEGDLVLINSDPGKFAGQWYRLRSRASLGPETTP